MLTNRLTSLLRFPSVGILTNNLKALSILPHPSKNLWSGASGSSNSFAHRYSSSLVSVQPNSQILQDVNNQLETSSEGRLFAVVQLCGKQFKITTGDIVIVEGYWPPTNGDQLRLDKVLIAGGKDFSLIGRPLVPAGSVDIRATIIEKTMSHTRTHFRKKRRKQYMRTNFYRTQQTMIRINSIELNPLCSDENDTRSEVERFY
ncbi:39S ribosomal protein L21, mitochondrial [Toxorhynchites rutilus septentrionalis]|uniref:39S ribosomal protein L21, mitochondrial n=1 Tax=Toxorhynchites rutilus septentrionalis TaxID=329112 RepID=UPI002478AE8A|nr:39S ribosomal protein L21, mitochondrial [Toxorhynchites rutilus septentrionalis]